MSADHPTTLRITVETLERLGISHFLFGASAQNLWGEPRFTRDLDLIVFVGDAALPGLLTALAKAGFSIDPVADLRRFESGRMLKVHRSGIPVDLVMGETDLDASALTRCRKVRYLGVEVNVVSPEDLMLYKLISSRTQDIADLEKVVRRQQVHLDRDYLWRWARWLESEAGLTHVPTRLAGLLPTGRPGR